MATRRSGVLLITVWSEGETLVARLRGFQGEGESKELRPAAGRGGILAAVSSWLHGVEFPNGEPETGEEGVTSQ
jgi:hypothetical protein